MFRAKEIRRDNERYHLLVEVTDGPNAGRQVRVAYDPRTRQLGHAPEPANQVLIGVAGETFAELLRAVEQAVEPNTN